ncbi:sortase domain-bontaining protein [Xylanimonas ulmi]|uniref:sortase domain-containing protein n=1 Tax=Xylanimonas ulmi TaxID=228973 RepID=UPI0013EE6944|nr:sortase [Xylanibacterium ulmi]
MTLLAAVVLAGWWAWENLGTSWRANHAEATALDAYTSDHPLPDQVGELRDDLDNAPPGPAAGTMGVLWVPSWAGEQGVRRDTHDGRTPIVVGVTNAVLARGAAGWFPQSPAPGEVGNTALAGHRRTYGDNFLHIDDLVAGDAIVVETPQAWFVYEVRVPGYLVDPARGAEVLAPAPAGLRDGGRYLTLVSCHSVTDGEWGNDHRMIVHAEQVGWLPHDAGVPPQLAGLASASASAATRSHSTST